MKYPDIDPVLVHLGPIQIRWYGLMYVIGFVLAFIIMLHMSRRRNNDLTRTEIEDLFAYCILGLIIGARLGYCAFYNLGYYLSNPIKILAVWEGGMSFHGGLIGMILVGWLFSVRRKKPFFMLADLAAIAAPPGLFFGRIGNFINGELYGRVTQAPWGMVFPDGGPLPRHPSQLYEAFFEGIVLLIIIYGLSFRAKVHGTLLASFLICYGGMRFCIEFLRQPDTQLGFVFGNLTMGQILCLLMLGFGFALLLTVRFLTDKRGSAKA